MRISSFGASVGSGPVHCVLLDIEDGHVVGREARTIDPGPYRFGRRGNLLSSGFDLLASHAERDVDVSAVTVRSRRDLLSVRLGARGGVRAAGIVREADAVLRGLDERGSIARYETALIADLGADGTRLYTVRDGVVVAERRTGAVVLDSAGIASIDAAAALVRSAAAAAPTAPDVLALVGSGALNTIVREAISGVSRDAGIEPLLIDEPETIAASGAALIAADRRAAGATPSSLVESGIGVLGGHSVRLTAAILPLLVVAALTGAVLATGYATGIIGPAARSTEQGVPTSSDSVTSAEDESATETTIATVTSSPPPERPVVPTTVPPEPGRGDEVTPTMTTFAPPPVVPTTTRQPVPTSPTRPPTSPTGTLPTTILPTIPTGTPSGTPTGSPSGTTAPGTPTEGTGTNPPSPDASLPAPGNGLVGPGAAGAQGAGGSSSNPVNTGAAKAGPSSAEVTPGQPTDDLAAPTVTEPAP
ncbi:hypothetical protein [Tsukamurella ocularis]|uniref:hypothetical protein n=1 Tax=Tsukamurella ocularis TaxID=1970234 RepID=UPI002167FED4|nr:hypothetical protein [Tsukamurella ocularis]MCS3778402.1 hypothetical protein [Tsukamurella ocularis]MCS3789103.1 hypothetical protein [Tsukamurella ocularis]MCS3852954.1 hypothetical protein [Tsukamurella ocularis]